MKSKPKPHRAPRGAARPAPTLVFRPEGSPPGFEAREPSGKAALLPLAEARARVEAGAPVLVGGLVLTGRPWGEVSAAALAALSAVDAEGARRSMLRLLGRQLAPDGVSS